jgi:hypothetical protein
MTNSTAISFRVIAQSRFDLPLSSSNHLRVSRTIEGGLQRVVIGMSIPTIHRGEMQLESGTGCAKGTGRLDVMFEEGENWELGL